MFKKIFKTVKEKLGKRDIVKELPTELPKKNEPFEINGDKKKKSVPQKAAPPIRKKKKPRRSLGHGRWNTTTIRFALQAFFKAARAAKQDKHPGVARRIKRHLENTLTTRRERAELHVWAIREKNREAGLNRHGFPIHGMKVQEGLQ